ncbi:SDR family oxidoreductase [Streptomyces antarcticus]|uniref:SDR family oxidoreductase n=1 Tax=Streptomyces antarcticus TaxID=2996458 RepID=UPI00226D504B|nr:MULTISPECIES: SDR family oxidoreductase [unclassified Streptomyces]MCY0942931.1 SDR family oxidoreductase [Streptomyces sp. H34-AA3]MCY0953022.1 SDR family oxidoreductase [Streptomyces sp. H27-S2]MCZ4083109.1 SDR family oxidoreductase [Streptomyces sp. H34-S5]
MSALLQNKVVVVSGVGPGLGRALAVRAAEAGADVVLAARTQSVLTETAAAVEATGRRALAVATDITDEAAARRLVSAAVDTFGRVDALVNNAFVVPPMAPLADVDLADIRTGFETNVYAALRMTRLFAPVLSEHNGSVVMVNSVAIRHSKPMFGAYKMAKAGLLALAQSLSTELGPQGVRVNTVAPGYIWAPALQGYFAYLAKERGVPEQQVYDEIAADLDLRRLPEPDEIADAVLFLLSDLARAVTGQCLDVNGGEYHN